MSARILALGLENAKTDSAKTRLLSALINFAKNVGDTTLAEEAKALLPVADPFRPYRPWQLEYFGSFEQHADESTGTYLDDMDRYCHEYWVEQLTDEQRQERVQNPSLGRDDGIKDAEALNAEDLSKEP